jgi:hypothetical protein
LSEMAREIVRILFKEDDEGMVERIVGRAVPEWSSEQPPTVWQAVHHRFPMAMPPFAGFNEQRPVHQRMIRAVADNYRPIFEGRALASLEWPKDLFYFASEGCVSPDDIELLGTARRLVWGPYMFLPLGYWRAQIEFEVIENLSGNKIEVDVMVGSEVAALKKGNLPAVGVYQFSMDFEVKELGGSIQVRILMLKGAIEGRFSLRRVTLLRREKNATDYALGAETHPEPKLIGA